MEAVGTRIQSILEQYSSPTAARVVLRAVLEPRGLQLGAITPAQLPDLVSAIIVTSTTLVGRTKLPSFKAAMYALLGDSAMSKASFAIATEADASSARLAARNMLERAGASALAGQQAATAVSELARNQLSYAGGGEITVVIESAPRKLVRIKAVDRGKGISDLAAILSGNYRSKTGMGLGLLGTKRMSNRFDVQTGPQGTTVETEIWL